MTTLEALKQLCGEATPGPWRAHEAPYNGYNDPWVGTLEEVYICQTVYDMQSTTQVHNVDADTNFIAASNPQTIRQLIDLVEKQQAGINAVLDLVSDSDGVYGLHRNGDPAPWTELMDGGRFEEWLNPVIDANDAFNSFGKE